MLFFGVFWFLYKGMWFWFCISVLLVSFTLGIAWFVLPFFSNDLHKKHLLKSGYLTEIQFRARRAEAESRDERMEELVTSIAKGSKPSVHAGSMADEIGKLNDLKNSGVLTEEEFQAQKKKLLASA